MCVETLPCSAQGASAVAVLVLLVVRLRCRGRGDRDGVSGHKWMMLWRRFAFVFLYTFDLILVSMVVGLNRMVLNGWVNCSADGLMARVNVAGGDILWWTE